MTVYLCCEQRRLTAVKRAKALNGIEYLEVVDHDATKDELRQRTLLVRLLLKPANPLDGSNVVIVGGERIRPVRVQWAATADAQGSNPDPVPTAGLDEPDHVLVVRTEEPGDFSRYELRLVAAPGSDNPPAGFDPKLARIQFSFKVECESDFDCREVVVCAPQPRPAPDIDYLAKDYPSLHRLLLDRISLLAPDWRERNPADLGVTLVELFAYLGDQLSYRQDAIATEAYLGTARRRASLRRHARLVDYLVHEGCSARAFAQVAVSAATTLPAGTPLLTRVPGVPSIVEPGGPEHRAALAAGATVFETIQDTPLDPDLATLHFWTWGDGDCCLPAGASRATLRGKHPALKAGDLLVLAEITSPTSGEPGDADSSHRCAVRLRKVTPGSDPSGGLFAAVPSGDPVDIVDIEWDPADALAFPLCLTATRPATDTEPAVELEVAVAYGNIAVADHGRTVTGEKLGEVPRPELRYAPAAGGAACAHEDPRAVPARFRPILRERPVSHVVDVRGTGPAASAITAATPRLARPAVVLTGTLDAATLDWLPQPDLLGSADVPEFVLEPEQDGTATLRFGDGVHGRRPEARTSFTARYRVGNGAAGNVGADALAHVATVDGQVTGVTNPLPAGGGVDPESAGQVRRDAPEAFKVQERAVTKEDWAEVAARHPQVQRAAATVRWTGSWHTWFVTLDRLGGAEVDADFEIELRAHLERYRVAGYDLEVDGPRYVALEVDLHVCLRPDHFRAAVRRDLLAVLGSGHLPDGRLGLFHPDNLTFGQTVYLSRIYAAAQRVPGVASVTVTRFARRGETDTQAAVHLKKGTLPMDRLEIARLANDPDYPERGILTLSLGGGK